MKESMSVTTIFQIVLLFILLFTAIMALTINNSNAFGVKDTIISAIEESNGNFKDSEGNLDESVVDAIMATSYRTSGKCDDGYIGYERNGKSLGDGASKAAVCIKEVAVTNGIDKRMSEIFGDTVATGTDLVGIYYQVKVFYQLDLPVVKQVYNFSTKGETRIIYQGYSYGD